jgi:hypothetical protein
LVESHDGWVVRSLYQGGIVTKRIVLAVWLATVFWLGAASTSGAQAPVFDDGWVLPPDQPTQVEMVSACDGGSYESCIHEKCAQYGCDPNQLIRVMYCESGGDPTAYRARGDGTGDVGLFQIHDGTWGSIAWAGPYAQIDWAAAMFANGQAGHWVCT